MTTSLLAAAGLTTMPADVAAVRLPLENLSVIVSAVLSPRFVKVAIPPETVAMSVPVSGPATGEGDRDDRAVVAGLEVAVLVLFVDDGLGDERGARRGRG